VDEGVELGAGELRLQQRGRQQRTLPGGLLLRAGHGAHGGADRDELLVGRALAHLVEEVQQVGDDLAVLLDGGQRRELGLTDRLAHRGELAEPEAGQGQPLLARFRQQFLGGAGDPEHALDAGVDDVVLRGQALQLGLPPVGGDEAGGAVARDRQVVDQRARLAHQAVDLTDLRVLLGAADGGADTQAPEKYADDRRDGDEGDQAGPYPPVTQSERAARAGQEPFRRRQRGNGWSRQVLRPATTGIGRRCPPCGYLSP